MDSENIISTSVPKLGTDLNFISTIAHTCEDSRCQWGLEKCSIYRKIYCKNCGLDKIPSNMKIELCEDCRFKELPSSFPENTDDKLCPECTKNKCIINKPICSICEKLYCHICGPDWIKRAIPASLKNKVICKECEECPIHNNVECDECTTIRKKLSGLYDNYILKPSDINPSYEVILIYEQTKSNDGEIQLYTEERVTGLPHFLTEKSIIDSRFFNTRNTWYYYIPSINGETRKLLRYKIIKRLKL